MIDRATGLHFRRNLTLPAAILLGVAGLYYGWTTVRGVQLLDAESAWYGFGDFVFEFALTVLYLYAAIRTWQQRTLGALVSLFLLVLWAMIWLRWGHSPFWPFAVAVPLVGGPGLALLSWQRLTSGGAEHPISKFRQILAGIAIAAVAAVAPLWNCHVGFGGRSDYHCHSLLEGPHFH